MDDQCDCVGRYQPGTLNFSSQCEKLVELVGGEKVAVSGDSGDEHGLDTEDHIASEKFSAKLLLVPSRDIPTKMSGTIVYATTAIICKNFALFTVCIGKLLVDLLLSVHIGWCNHSFAFTYFC